MAKPIFLIEFPNGWSEEEMNSVISQFDAQITGYHIVSVIKNSLSDINIKF